MTNAKISALTALTGIDTADLVPIVDVSDTSMASSGTTKKVTMGNVATAINASVQLAPTGVKTSAYSPVAQDFVPVDTTSGAVTITLPTAPSDKTLVGVKLVIQGSTNAVTVAAGGSDVFNKASGPTTLTLNFVNQTVILQYKSSGAIWYVLTDDVSVVHATGNETINGTKTFQAPSNADAIDINDNSGVLRSAFDKDGYGFTRPVTFALALGTPATVGNDKTNWINVLRNGKIQKAFINAKTAPTGAAFIVDILKSSDGGSTFTSIWNTTTANRLQLAATSKVGTQTAFDTTAVTEGDLLRIDVVQVGSTVAGQDITVNLLLLVRNQ